MEGLTMRVNVTQAHIDRGRLGECHTCPVALALLDATGISWLVGRTWAWASPPPSEQVDLPAEVGQFIHAFDHGDRVEPFSFELARRGAK